MTLEELETLANQICTENEDAKTKLCRMITSYAKIINAREPEQFKPRATIYADEDGHYYDNSYPPKQQFKERNGPRTIRVIEHEFTSRATSEGFYHDLTYFTTNHGLYVGTKGELYGGTISGTGSFGQFAAYPGECGVDCTIEWAEQDLEDVSHDALKLAEETLREKSRLRSLQRKAASR